MITIIRKEINEGVIEEAFFNINTSEGIRGILLKDINLPESSTDEDLIEYFKENYDLTDLQLEWRKSASLSRRRFKIGEAIYQVNGAPLKDSIATLLEGLSEPQKTVATIAYQESGQFDRMDDFVVQFSSELGMTEEETDEFFRFCINEGWR